MRKSAKEGTIEDVAHQEQAFFLVTYVKSLLIYFFHIKLESMIRGNGELKAL
jgi:hypothetical protein